MRNNYSPGHNTDTDMKTYFRLFLKNNDKYIDCEEICNGGIAPVSGKYFIFKKDGKFSTITVDRISSISHFLEYSSGKFDRTEISINQIY